MVLKKLGQSSLNCAISLLSSMDGRFRSLACLPSSSIMVLDHSIGRQICEVCQESIGRLSLNSERRERMAREILKVLRNDDL